MDTTFLERRELQLLFEAEQFPSNSSQNTRLLRLSDKLFEAAATIQAGAAAVNAERVINPWHDRVGLLEAPPFELFQGAAER